MVPRQKMASKKKRWRKEGTDKTEDGTKTKYNVIINNVKWFYITDEYKSLIGNLILR